MVDMINDSCRTYGIEKNNKFSANLELKNGKNRWKTSNIDKNSENNGAQQATSEIIVVDGQKMLLISQGMFKMKINLGAINLETPAYGKAGGAETEKKSNEASETKTAKSTEGTAMLGAIKNGMAEVENQYVQNDAIAAGMSRGMTFSAGI